MAIPVHDRSPHQLELCATYMTFVSSHIIIMHKLGRSVSLSDIPKLGD